MSTGGDPEELSLEQREALGDRIRQCADAIGTRAAAAKIAGISPQHLHNLMKGKALPTLMMAARLAEAAGYRLEWITNGTGSRDRDRAGPGVAPAIAILDERERRRAAKGLPPSDPMPLTSQNVERLDAASDGVVRVMADKKLMDQLDVLFDLYEGAGVAIDREDDDNLVDVAIERIRQLGSARELWPDIAAMIIDAHRRAIRVLKPRRG